MLQVRLPGSATFSYALPSLHEPELKWIRSVEQRLHTASYDTHRCVPVFWDTEATGLGSVLWWAPRRHRIVQIAAALDSGSREFKVNINPYPVAMSDGAAETTGLTTPTVWANTVPPQVRIACKSDPACHACTPCVRPKWQFLDKLPAALDGFRRQKFCGAVGGAGEIPGVLPRRVGSSRRSRAGVGCAQQQL